MMVVDFESLPPGLVALITNTLFPCCNCVAISNVLLATLKVKLLFALPLTVRETFAALLTLEMVALTRPSGSVVVYGLVAGVVIVMLGGNNMGCL